MKYEYEYIYVFKNKPKKGEQLHEQAPLLNLVRREEDGNWTQLAGGWKTKGGDGYSFRLEKGVSITVQDPDEVDKEFNAVSSGADEINADDIPFD